MEKIMNRNFKCFDKKLLLQYTLIFFFSLFVGFFLPRFLNEDLLLSMYHKIALHFEVPVYSVEKISDWLHVALKYSLADIICLSIIALFSFSLSSSIISAIVLIYIGLKNGCELSLVYLTYTSSIEYFPSLFEIGVFFILKILIIAFFIRYIIYASFFSENMHYVSRSKNVIIIETSKFIITSLLHACFLLFLHGIYCFTIKSI